ncbi:hypothetical protein Rhe02_52220 [Rhizocola hellebori]|uniref:Uncharacterized protein n=1 Tax=Rhizocola hellebori TaxID=1392758 RepID=A0A8J3QAY0_9ACTN|nr:hypothetical protein [Rhizocola hellebori]GIH07155.1 hypothetical protein Rhe02_52220 [Rhizocola hellebori]
MLSERRARRMAQRAAAGNGEDFGFWAKRAWRKLAAAAWETDQSALNVLCTIVGDTGSPRRQDALDLIATTWVFRRLPQLREHVVGHQAMAHGHARLVTAALHGQLAQHWTAQEANIVRKMLSDADPDVQAGAVSAIRAADSAMVHALWTVVPGMSAPLEHASHRWWEDPLATILISHRVSPPSSNLDHMWRTWITNAGESMWVALSNWRIPGTAQDVRTLSMIAVEPDVTRLTESDLRPALLESASRAPHPIAEIAQAKILDAIRRSTGHELADEVCEAATQQPVLAAFCRRHKLAPADPVRRAAFFILTQQPEQLQALDPDGSLLSLAYATADPQTRKRLQKGMLTSGSLDLVKVLAGEDRRGRLHLMSDEEIKYLTEQLAARAAWEELWRIVLEMPMARSIRLMQLFAGGWLPRDDDSRELFTRLASFSHIRLESGTKELHGIWPVAVPQARIKFHGRINDVSFAPDAPQLAVAGSSRVAGIVDLTQARLTERYDGFASSVGRVLHLGAGMFLAAERTNRKDHECRVIRCADQKRETLIQLPGSITSLAPAGPGRFVAGTRSGELLIGASAFVAPTRVPMTRLEADPEYDWPRTVAADPQGQRLAVLGRTLILTDGSAAGVLGRGFQHTVVARAVMLTADLLAASDQNGNINLLRHQRHVLRPIAGASVAGLGGLAAIPSRQHLVAADRAGQLSFYDQTTLKLTSQIACPPGGGHATSVHAGARGDFLAVGYDSGHADIYDLRIGDVPSLVTRSLSSMVPAHLGVLAAARRVRAVSGPPAEVLDLLQACLEHRFRFDIEISETVTIATGEYDIALA